MCARRGIFTPSRLDLVEECPHCGLVFEREAGFWVGSLIVIMALVLAVFTVVVLGGILVFWPDVPWTSVLIASIVANAVVPICLYGWAKSVWLSLSWGYSPPDDRERGEILAWRAAAETARSG